MFPLAASLALLFSLQEPALKKTRELVEWLRSDSIEERDDAAAGLVALREAARPGLERALEDSDPEVALRARQALVRIRSPGCARAVLPALDDEWGVVRQEALHALALLGAKEAVPEIVKRLEDRALRQSALYALGTLRAREAAPQVRACLQDPDPYVRRQAARALQEMGLEPTLAPAAPEKRE